MNRRGEKLGWIGGWLGGFVWVLILAVVVMIQGKTLLGIIGLAIVVVAVVAIVMSAPWRHPQTQYRTLMIPVYVLFLVSVAWAIWAYGADELGLSWPSVFLLLPILLPVWIAGKRRWNETME